MQRHYLDYCSTLVVAALATGEGVGRIVPAAAESTPTQAMVSHMDTGMATLGVKSVDTTRLAVAAQS